VAKNNNLCYFQCMNVSLTPELERRIADRLEGGLYTSASEVVREALRLFFAVDEEQERLRAEFDAEIQIAVDQIERGEGLSVEESYRRVTDVINARRRKAG